MNSRKLMHLHLRLRLRLILRLQLKWSVIGVAVRRSTDWQNRVCKEIWHFGGNLVDDLPEPPTDAPPTTGTSNRLRWILGGLLLILLVGVVYWFWPSEIFSQAILPCKRTFHHKPRPTVPIAVTPPDEPVIENKDPKQTEEITMHPN